MRVANAFDLRRCFKGEHLRALDWMAYSGSFDSTALDHIADALSARSGSKGLKYYLASLYLQLGEADKVDALLNTTGMASSEMKWFAMLMLYCRYRELPLPRLKRSDDQCLDYLQEKYLSFKNPAAFQSEQSSVKQFTCLLQSKKYFAVIGNAPVSTTDTDSRFQLTDDCLSVCFNNYHLNPRIEGQAFVHVVTPSWRSGGQWRSGGRVHGKHLIITGNSIFHRRSKVWRRFSDQPRYTRIHTVPREIWSSLVEKLGASPSAGLLLLSYFVRHLDINDKDGLVAGFSEDIPVQNHSYDSDPVSLAHNWIAEAAMRGKILQSIGSKTRSLRVVR